MISMRIPRDSYGVKLWFLIVIFIAILMLVVTLFLVCALVAQRWSCNQLQSNTGYDTRYTIANGCLIHLQNGWVPDEKWRQLQ